MGSLKYADRPNLDVPVLPCDARQRASCRDALVTMVEHAIRLLSVSPDPVSFAR